MKTIQPSDIKSKLAVGDRVRHKHRGWGTVCQCEEFNSDPTSIMVALDEDPSDTLELTLALIEEYKHG